MNIKFVELNKEKKPLVKELTDEHFKDTFEQWDNAGLIIGNDVIVLDFDGDNPNEDIIKKHLETNYPTLTITTDRGKHYYYAMPKGYKFRRLVDAVSVLGFQCDYLIGAKAYATIKLNGKTRDMNMPLSFDNLPTLPEELYPLEQVKDKKLSGMVETDGRNDALYRHLIWIRKVYPDIDISNIADTINDYIFGEKFDKPSELNSVVNSVSKASIQPYKNHNRVNRIKYESVRALQLKDLPPITFYVETLIPQGLTILCSLPKIGKSFMAFDLCLCIAQGLPFLGFNTTKAGCFYLALEDSENRLQGRQEMILKGEPAPDNFYYAIKCDDVDNGLIDEMKTIIEELPDVKVIVIDTLQKIRGNFKGSNQYAQDYHELGKIKEFADEKGLSIILIHHAKKGKETDVFGKVSGTNGITGTVDTTLLLDKKERTDEDTVLSVVGRDVEFNEYIIRHNKETLKWDMVASGEERKEEDEQEEYENHPLVNTIKTLVDDNNGKWTGILEEIKAKQLVLFPNLIDKSVSTKGLSNLAPLLKKYDNIDYFAYGYPIDGKRLKVFTRLK